MMLNDNMPNISNNFNNNIETKFETTPIQRNPDNNDNSSKDFKDRNSITKPTKYELQTWNEENIKASINYENLLDIENDCNVNKSFKRKYVYNLSESAIGNEHFKRSKRDLKPLEDISHHHDSDEEISGPKNVKTILTFKEQVEIIKSVDDNLSKKEICEMFSCSPKQIDNILQKCNAIMDLYEKRSKALKKCSSSSSLPLIEKSMRLDTSNALSLEDSINVIKLYDLKSSSYKLAINFNCSKEQIKSLINRCMRIEKYNELCTDNEMLPTSYYLRRCFLVIRAYDQCKSYPKLQRLFNFSVWQLETIIQNRKAIIKLYQDDVKANEIKDIQANNNNSNQKDATDPRTCQTTEPNPKKFKAFDLSYIINKPNDTSSQTSSEDYIVHLDLDDRIKIIILYISYHMTYFRLSNLFNCTVGQIKYCIQNSNAIYREYKRLNPDYNDNELINFCGLESRLSLIKAFKNGKKLKRLGRRYNFTPKQIRNIIRNRDAIIAQHLEVQELSNIPENFIISSFKEVLMVLQPLQAYAKSLYKSNSSILDLMSQLKEHIVSTCISKSQNNTESSIEGFQYLEVDSYNEALKALRPVANYAKTIQIKNAKYLMAQLQIHLIKNNNIT